MAGFQSGGQTDYSLFPYVGGAGQRYRASSSDEVVDYVALATIQPGQLLEVVTVAAAESPTGESEGVRPAQSASGALKPVAGVALYVETYAPLPGQAAPPNYFMAGDRIPVLRKGRVYAQWSGTTQGVLVTANYYHESTGATAVQGVITDAATSATAGSEVDALPAGMRVVRPTAQSGQRSAPNCVLLELNLPSS
jgi:hypothetical protein